MINLYRLLPLNLFLIVSLVSFCWQSHAAPKQEPQTGDAAPQLEQAFSIELAASGLPAKTEPESLLPAGAVLHVRINNSQELLDDASDMLTPFIPEKAIGPPAVMALKEKNPLLALVGLQTMGQPLSVEMLSGMSGIDPARPITLSFYLDEPQNGYVLCVPVLDLERPSGMLQNVIPPNSSIDKLDLERGSAQYVQAPDLDMYIVCSDDTICICGSLYLAQALLTDDANQKLSQSKLISEAVKKHATDNLLIAVDNAPIKAFLPAIEQFHYLPPAQIAQLRADLLAEFGPAELENINRQISTHSGIRDIEQLMDYVEAIATGSYEVAFETLAGLAEDFNGMTIAIDLTDECQSVKISVLSDAISQSKSTQPLPLSDVLKSIKSLPGPHDFLVMSGRAPQPEKSQFLAELVKRIGQKMNAKELPMDFHGNIVAAIDGYTPVAPLASKVDWTVSTSFFTDSKPATEYDNLQSFFSEFMSNLSMVSLDAIPLQDKGFLESYFKEKSATTNANYANWTGLWKNLDAGDSLFHKYSDQHAEALENGVHKLTYEDCYRTNGGLFGYNEHELINRYFTLYRNNGDHTLLWPGGNDPDRFLTFKPKPVAAAIDRLVANAQLSDDVHRIEIWRNIHGVLGLFDFADGVETVLHKELDTYRSSLQKVMDEAGPDEDPDEIVARMENIEVPLAVAHVHAHPESRQVYLVTPAGLTFPRPKIVPVALELLDEFREVSDSVGGAIVHHTARDGQFDLVVTQSTGGVSKLVRSVGNEIADRYLNNPEGQQRLQELFSTELDQSADSGGRLFTNKLWIFLD